MRRTMCAALCLALLSLIPAQSAAATPVALPPNGVILVPGHGWGHGRGMGQWGARGMADNGAAYTTILNHYYSGVTWATRSATEDIRVLVEHSSDIVVTSEAPFTISWSSGRAIGTSSSSYPFWRVSWDGDEHLVEKSASYDGPWTGVNRGGAYVVFTRGSKLLELVKDTGNVFWFRGKISARHASVGNMYGINELRLQEYLYGVVPRETPSSWPAEALKAQAVAARTYSVYKKDYARSKDYPSDICATSSCQNYLGYGTATKPGASMRHLEASATNSAVDATNGKVLLYGGKPILAEYSSSTGGYSAQGSVPYQKAVPDPGDAVSPHHDWKGRLTVADIENRWPSLGRLTGIKVSKRNGYGDWGGRVEEMQVAGTSGTVTLSGNSFRNAFAWPSRSQGLQSDWFSIVYWKGELNSAPDTVALGSGEQTSFTALIRNTGTAYWTVGGQVRLSASSSRFHSSEWVSSSRPASVSRNASASSSKTVAPGQVAAFDVPIDAKDTPPGTYTEPFTAVADGMSSMTPTFSVKVQVLPGLIQDAANILENASFESGLSAWSGSGLRSSSVHRDGSGALRLAGGTRSVAQTIPLAGGKARTFVLGGWNRGDSTSSSGGAVELTAIMRYTDGSTSTARLGFSRASHPWTYDELAFTSSATRELSSMSVRAAVSSQRGSSYFDAVRLVESPLANPSFEDGMSGWRTSGFAAGDGSTTGQKHDATRSLGIASGASKTAYQTVSMHGRRGERLLLSLWTKAAQTSMAVAKFTFTNTDRTTTPMSLNLPTTGTWTRHEFVVAPPKEFSRFSFGIGVANQPDNVYVDAVRLTRTWVRDASFELGYDGWTPNGFSSGDGLTASDPREGPRAIVFTGPGRQNVVQQISIGAGAGYRLVVSGWNRTASVRSSDGPIGFVLAFRNGSSVSYVQLDLPRSPHGWRYFERAVKAPRRFTRVDLYVKSDDQHGWSVFDGVGLRMG